MSFIADKIVMDGLTYDDVLLIPAYSEVLPKTVELSTKFSRAMAIAIFASVTVSMAAVTNGIFNSMFRENLVESSTVLGKTSS